GHGGGGIDQRRVTDDVDLGVGGSELELRVDLLFVAGLQSEAVAVELFESGRGNGETVAAGQQKLNDPVTLRVGFCGLLDSGVVGRDHYRRVRRSEEHTSELQS